MTSVFDHLADLVLIEIFSYLSSTDALCAFTCLNARWTRLLAERGFFRQVNLSPTYSRQFDQLLQILSLNHIETLVIDRSASPLQLRRWPYLPRLSKLHIRGLREYDTILSFVLLHAATLTHVTIQSDAYCVTHGISAKCLYSIHSFRPLVQNILLRYLPNLRTLDLGFDSSHSIMDWNTILVRAPLTYLRVTVHHTKELLAIMMTRPLSTSLRCLHVKVRDNGEAPIYPVYDTMITLHMSSLRTFTFIKPLSRQFADEWTFFDALTSSTVMPVLQRAKLIVAIDVRDLNWIDRSALFNDHRRVDVQYAFILNDDLYHTELDQRIPRGSRSHPRSVASATFVRGTSNESRPYAMSGKSYFLQMPQLSDRSHLWYTLPWAFNELTQLPIPDKNISQLEVWQPPRSSTMLSWSRLVRMDLICNEVSPILTRSPIMCPENIEELHLFCCDRHIDLKFPSLRHLTVISSLDALHRCSPISMNIQSLTIVLHGEDMSYATGNWSALRSLHALPRLQSLRVVLYDLHMSDDDPSCQIIAETAVWFVDFAFSFRRGRGFSGINSESAFQRCCSFIEQLRRKIFALSVDEKPNCSVENDGCGLIVWREQRYHDPTQTL